MRTNSIPKAVVLAFSAILIGGFWGVAPVYSRDIGSLIGGSVISGALNGLGAPPSNRSRRARHKDNSDDDSMNEDHRSKKTTDDNVLASIGAPSAQRQTVILKSIDVSGVIGAVGSKSLTQIGVTSSSEAERDDTAQINNIIARFKMEQDKSGTPGDVTAHAIEQSLDKAFKESKLNIFESFVGENWSAERLRVMILARVMAELPQLFQGNNRGNAPMEELDQLIRRSAESVNHRLFEISELLAANRSTTLFAQRLYQTHGRMVDDELREVTDRMITKAANTAVMRFDSLFRRDEDGIAVRYRAERIVLDCLSENVARITSSETGIATVGEIEQNIVQTATGQCEAWLENQFGTDKDKLKAQKPMPLRAVWSPTGPRDDPSMYGRVSGQL
jgi:hypothetical protein